ncbi:MAG TPA: CDP-alcohol phosphatidyltransferase family protein [Candidatus Eisenbacteria bacterium]|nr:CDP-alcohol phosphatidyltransferase family protein [Candidatus Eisenbacteria bacterium]
MFAEDLLRDLRQEGFTPTSVALYFRRILARIVGTLAERADLVRSVAGTSFVLFAIQFGAALLLSWAFGRRVGVTYIIASSVTLLIASFWILAHIGLAGTPEVRSLRRIPLPVALTLLRLAAVPAIVLLAREGRWSVVVWLFAASAFTDVLDGVVARALHMESIIGAVLDPAIDVFFNATVFIALTVFGALPWWVTALMLTRYGVLILGTCYLYLFHGPVKIQPTAFGKLTGLLTSVLVGLLLLALAYWSDAMRSRLKEVFDVGLGVLAGATIIQVLFIGLANKRALDQDRLLEQILPPGPPQGLDPGSRAGSGKVVGDVRWPRR